MSKTCKKATLLTVLLTVLLVAAIVVGALVGFNKGAGLSKNDTLTVSVNQALYNTQLSEVEKECEKVLGGAEVLYTQKGEMSGDESEIVYVFAEGVDVQKMATSLSETFASRTANEQDVLFGGFVKVMANASETKAFVAEGYLLRGAIAAVVFALLAFAYVTVRAKWHNGLVAGLTVLFAMTTTASVILLARIPVTAATAYAVVGAGLVAAIAVALNLKKDADKAATKSIVFVGVCTAVAMVLAGVLGGCANLWFVACAVLGVMVSAVLGIYFAPAVRATLQPIADAQAAAKDKFAYKGAKKLAKNEVSEDQAE